MTEIYLIRHAEAEGNVFRRIHGQYNSLLTPRGMQQVAYVQKRFENIPIAACFSSNLTRTSLTARAIYRSKGLKLQRDPRFREINLGIWEDVPFGYLDHFAAEQMYNFNHNPPAWRMTGAESYQEYTDRFLEGMLDAAQAHAGETIAIFAHGAVIRGTLMRLFFHDQVAELPYCDNTGVCKLIYQQGKFSYAFLNDNSHLPQQLSTFALQHWWRATGNRKDVNLYYVPYREGLPIRSGLKIPEMDENGMTLAAILHDQVVAVVSMAASEEDRGRIIGMSLPDDLNGRLYGDQLLGCAVSHFRRLGCKTLAVNQGNYPDDILRRYEFDMQSMQRSIDAEKFCWD